MKKLFYILIIEIAAGSLTAVAGEATLFFQIKSDKTSPKIAFIQNDQLHLMVSKSCYSEKREKPCVALQVLKKVSYKKVESALKGGRNPGIALCTDLLGAQSVIGIDSEGNQNSFCAFSDGSYVDTGTLTRYGFQNDERQIEVKK